MKNLIFLLLAAVVLAAGCSGCEQAKKKAQKELMKNVKMPQTREKEKLDPSEMYSAIVREDMTLEEVAEANDVELAFLKRSLGIPHYVDYPYTVLQLSRNYKFTINDLKGLIQGLKDKETMREKKKDCPQYE